MALIGAIEAFNPKETDITTYLERMDQLFICNDVDQRKKVSVFLTLIGGEAYSVLKDLLAPILPSTKTYDVLKEQLLKQYAPKRLIIAERYKFYSAIQESEEDVKTFAIKLKNLAKHCEFNAFLNEALRDKFVCGLKSEVIKRKLLTEDGLTFERGFQIATGMELAEGQIKVMGTEQVFVNKVFHNNADNKVKVSNANRPGNSNKDNNFRHTKNFSNKCKRCNRIHFNNQSCPAINWKCYSCHQKGHTAKSIMCKNKVNVVEKEEDSTEEDEGNTFHLGLIEEIGELYPLELLPNKETDSLKVKIHIEDKILDMEVDSGACKSVIHVDDYKQWFSNIKLENVKFRLKVVTGENVHILGKISVNVFVSGKKMLLPLVVVTSNNKFIPLLGRNWLNVLNPNWKQFLVTSTTIASVSNDLNKISNTTLKINKLISDIKSKFHDLFSDEKNSGIKRFKASICLKDGAKPIFHRAYEMPYALKPKVENELLKMVNDGIITKVSHSNWASPIVVVPKKNTDDIRICVDFKKTVNKVIDSDHCVLPLPDDIYAHLAGGKCFTVLDLKGAYQQLEIDQLSKEYFTINTHLGLFRFNRLTYGVSSAPGIFQSIMENILTGLNNVQCYLDDILIWGTTVEECNKNVWAVLSRLTQYNVKVNEKKCKFFTESVEFLGHLIDAHGIHPTNEKIECIEKTPVPQNLTQLKSYLGLLNYYRKFIPMLSTKLKPLYNLCKADSDFSWTNEIDKAFKLSKQILMSSDVLMHFDPSLPITITCDSSGYGVGAVLSHIVEGVEKPVLFASSTLTPSEQKYSNLERESLAIIFALKKFHKYIFGRKFTLITDHQPLQFIFGKNKGIPVTAAARITRWSLILAAYDYDIQYKKGNLISNADGLSRNPMLKNTEISECIYSFALTEQVPLSAEDIAKATSKDIILTKVLDLTLSGWPNHVNDQNLKVYFQKRHELSVENNCLLLGSKVVIPDSLRKEVLNLFHEQHLGVVRTKMLIRSYCWWPRLNDDIEKFVGSCEICQQNQNFSNNSSLISWPRAPNNFYRVYIDFFHKFSNTFLILIDSKSKWIDVKLMSRGTNASEVIIKLKEMFSVYGLPVELVSDNGPPFNSREFVLFCQVNGIKPVKSPPYHPQSNGSAERAVQTVKKGLEKTLFLEKGKQISRELLLNRLLDFLFIYRNTPCSVTKIPPSECLFKKKPRTRFDLLKPSYSKQAETNSNDDTKRNIKLYTLNEPVYVKDVQTKLWQKAKIVKIVSHCTYLVKIGNENIKFIHANDIRSNPYENTNFDFNSDNPLPNNNHTLVRENVEKVSIENVEPNTDLVNRNNENNEILQEVEGHRSQEIQNSGSYSTRSGRVVRPPSRLNL